MTAAPLPQCPPPGLRLDDLMREIPGGAKLVGDPSTRVRGVRQDSRRVEPGELFVGRAGERVDGAKYVADAIARGASAVLLAEAAGGVASLPVPALYVRDVVTALAHVSAAVYEQPSFALDVVGITGTNGKTTTAHLARAAIDAALGRAACGILGTVGHAFREFRAAAEHTTPEADEISRVLAAMRQRGATHAAMEVSSHALALGRVTAVHFRVAALTNLTQDHLDFHGSMTDYGAAKAKLFTELGPAAAVLNVDDPFGRDLARSVAAPVIRVTAQPRGEAAAGAQVALLDVRHTSRGLHAHVRTPGGAVTIDSHLVGAHNLENLLVALGIACALDLDIARAAEGLSRAAPPPGRLERCDVEGDTIAVLVDYAHTPDALERALHAVRDWRSSGRVWCVFGCGGDRDPSKREPMGRVAGRRADVVVVTSDNPRSEDPVVIADAVGAGVRALGVAPIVELDRRKAIERAVCCAADGDVVVIAGKGHEEVQVFGTVKHPFDDRDEARRALAQRRAQRGGA